MKKTLFKILLLIVLILVFRSVIFPAISWKGDEFFYLTIAREMNDGRVLYTDCADIKPVGIYCIYALADKLAGHDLQMDFLVLRIFSVSAVLLISLMLWYVGRTLYNERAGYFAALLFAVYSTCVRGSEVLAANTELFSVLFLAASLCFFCRGRFRLGYRDLLPAAFFLSLSFLVSSRAGIVVVAYVVFLFLFSKDKVGAFLKTLASAAVFLIPFGAVVLYYYCIGSLEDFLNWQFFFIKYYVGGYTPLMRIFRGILVYRFFAGLLPLVFFAGYLFFPLKKERFNKSALFFLVLLASLWIGVFSGGKHVERYYFPLFIPLAVLAGAGLESFLQSYGQTAIKWLLLFLLLSSPVVYLHMNIISMWLNKYPKTYHAYMEDKQAAIDYVVANTSKDDRLLVWPFGDLFYCATDRKMATPIFDPSGHLLAGKYLDTREKVDRFYNMFFQHLEALPPKVIIDSTEGFGIEGSDINEYMVPYLEKLKAFVRTNYDRADVAGKYTVYKRKNG